MLTRLNNDHKNIVNLLHILEVKYEKLKNGEAVSYTLIRDIIEYMKTYAENSHDPLEDIIDSYYTATYPYEKYSKELAIDHQKLIDSTSSLMTKLNLILNDAVVSRERLAIDLKLYVTEQKKHILYENSIIFPMWSTMTDKDWQNIQQQCSFKLIDDPLFNSDDSLFEELREYITESKDALSAA
ncbi:hemerythrin domain-containing protein [Shewanella sp. VB17]|uniref:hemerythrin domain-containing protein n=1 Tax=Shewanella sp. VB17 TaxID=2739432 RepID=UPI0020B8731A|nr:hemerythrin domain-containing protein [Shewanella sp. VB17]